MYLFNDIDDYNCYKNYRIKMSKHNSKVLKVYEQCQTVMKLKRRFLQQIKVPSLPNFQNSRQFNDIKDYSVENFFKQAGQNYMKYKQQISSKKAIQHEIQSNIKKIKNTKDITSRHEQIQHELNEQRKKWQQQDPLIYYQINERIKFKNNYKQKFKQFKESESGIKTIKNPHFVHKLINQLKQNLQQISLEDKQYDIETQQNTQQINKYLKDLTYEMEINIQNIRYKNYIFEQKKKLFSQFLQIDLHANKGLKNSRNQHIIKHYFQQLILVSKDILNHYKKQKLFIQYLIQYFKQVSNILKQSLIHLQKKYRYFIQEVFKNKQIRVILRIDIQERINSNLKMILNLNQIIKNIPYVLENYKLSLIQSYNQANNYHERYINKQLKFKDATDSFQKMLIQHKGYFSSLQKKQQKFNQMNIQNLKRFVRDLHQTMKILYHQNIKYSKLKSDIPLHDMINKIFAQYNFAQQHSELSQTQSTIENKDINLQAKIKQFQKFIESIQIFDSANINWSNSYFSCSLGPKLLIHGFLQILQSGIYYQSSFNKKNYFFGKTKLFIPKADIYQVNKQIALLVFPDVIEIKANKGQIYFHALGKRDIMYQQLISIYFPQVPQTQNLMNRQIQFQFNQFKGQNIQDKAAYKIKPYSVDFGQSVLKNCDLRVIFRRYFSDDSFTYQGKQYRNFKCYQLQHVGGLNASSNQLTPPPPYYFMKKGQPIFSQAVPDFSIRLATFQKKIPVIPFISKGGTCLCEEKSTYYWGGPNYFAIQIQTNMKGFKLTQAMTVRLNIVFRQDKQKNEVRVSTTCDIEFSTQGALSGTIKNEAMAQTRTVIQKTIQVIQKNEKNRSVYKNKGNSISQQNGQKQQFKDEIQRLKDENKKLNQRIKIIIGIFIVIYLVTILLLKTDNSHNSDKILIDREQYEELIYRKDNSGGFWSIFN